MAQFRDMRDVLELPIPDSALSGDLVPYWHPGENSEEVQYLRDRRTALGGPAPVRKVVVKPMQLSPAAPFEADEGLRQTGGGHHHGSCPAGQGPDAR